MSYGGLRRYVLPVTRAQANIYAWLFKRQRWVVEIFSCEGLKLYRWEGEADYVEDLQARLAQALQRLLNWRKLCGAVLRLPPRGGRGVRLRRLLRAGRIQTAQTLQGLLLCGQRRPPARRRLRSGVHKEQIAGARMGGVAAQSLPAALRCEGTRQEAEESSPPTPRMVRPTGRGLRAGPPHPPAARQIPPPSPAAEAQAQSQDVGRGGRRRHQLARPQSPSEGSI
jgi:hypothetical protein